jgi:hypothetical protein
VRELRNMFDGSEDLRIEKVSTRYDRAWAGPLATLAGDRLEWFVAVTRRRKPER